MAKFLKVLIGACIAVLAAVCITLGIMGVLFASSLSVLFKAAGFLGCGGLLAFAALVLLCSDQESSEAQA